MVELDLRTLTSPYPQEELLLLLEKAKFHLSDEKRQVFFGIIEHFENLENLRIAVDCIKSFGFLKGTEHLDGLLNGNLDSLGTKALAKSYGLTLDYDYAINLYSCVFASASEAVQMKYSGNNCPEFVISQSGPILRHNLDEVTKWVRTRIQFIVRDWEIEGEIDAQKNHVRRQIISMNDFNMENGSDYFDRDILFLERYLGAMPENESIPVNNLFPEIFVGKAFLLFDYLMKNFVREDKGRITDIKYFFSRMEEDGLINRTPVQFHSWFYKVYGEDLGQPRRYRANDYPVRRNQYNVAKRQFDNPA